MLIPISYDISGPEIAVLHSVTDGHAFAAADNSIRETGFLQVLQAFRRVDPSVPGVPAERADTQLGIDILRELDAVDRLMAVLRVASVICPMLGSILSVQLCRSISDLRSRNRTTSNALRLAAG